MIPVFHDLVNALFGFGWQISFKVSVNVALFSAVDVIYSNSNIRGNSHRCFEHVDICHCRR